MIARGGMLANYPQVRSTKLLAQWNDTLGRSPAKDMLSVSLCQANRAIVYKAYGILLACPSVYHEFEGPEAIPYDTEGTL